MIFKRLIPYLVGSLVVAIPMAVWSMIPPLDPHVYRELYDGDAWIAGQYLCWTRVDPITKERFNNKFVIWDPGKVRYFEDQEKYILFRKARENLVIYDVQVHGMGKTK